MFFEVYTLNKMFKCSKASKVFSFCRQTVPRVYDSFREEKFTRINAATVRKQLINMTARTNRSVDRTGKLKQFTACIHMTKKQLYSNKLSPV